MGAPIEIESWIGILRTWAAGEKQQVLPRIAQRLDGYVAVTDAPGSQFVPELLQLYPGAMVVCTVRDPAAWAKSHSQVAGLATLWFLRAVLLPLPGMRHFVDYIHALQTQWDQVYGKERSSDYIYHRHLEWLKEVVPADRLLFFDVKEGWGPLCKALGKEVPDIPFPRINDSEAMDRTAQYHIKRGMVRWAGAIALLAIAAVWLKR